MSLINDALKRARQTQSATSSTVTPPPLSAAAPAPQPSPAPSVSPPPASLPPPPLPAASATISMRPVERPARPSFPAVLWPLFLLAVVAAGVWVFVKGWSLVREASAPSSPVSVAAREPASPEDPAANAPVTSAPAQDGSATATATAPEGETPEPPPPAFPTLKLQGIFYRPTNPSAVINSKTLFIGERIEGVRVVAIQRDSVKVEWEGQSKELILP